MSNIVINGLTFVGNGIIAGLNSFIERSAGIVNGFKILNNRVTLADRSVVSWKFVLPKVIAADSPCGCAGQVKYTDYVDIVFKFDRATPPADRLAYLELVQDLVLEQHFVDSVTQLVSTP